MTESKFQRILQQVLENMDPEEVGLCDSDCFEVRSVVTFKEAGVLTYNKGLAVKLETGDEFQLTIVKSSRGHGSDEDEDGEDEE